MQCAAQAPVVWPDDDEWQRVWVEAIHELELWEFDSSGQLVRDGSPRVLVTQGSHLRSGAVYRIGGDTLIAGEIVATIEGDPRTLRLTCRPPVHTADERAELTVHNLDRLDRIALTSTLPNLAAQVQAQPRTDALLHLSVTLPWLDIRLELAADSAHDDVLRGELELTGVGLWRPILAPFLAAADSQVEKALQEIVSGVASALGQVPALRGALGSALPWSRDPAAVEQRIRTGMDELARRMHAVEQSLAGVSWWRRDAGRWRKSHDALGRGAWPPDNALAWQRWSELDRAMAASIAETARWRRRWSIDRAIKLELQLQLSHRRDLDATARRLDATRPPRPRPRTEPWPTDDDLDLAWLATPWSTIRRLSGVATDAEAQEMLSQVITGSQR